MYVCMSHYVALQTRKPKFNPQNLSKSARRDLTIQKLSSDLCVSCTCAHTHLFRKEWWSHKSVTDQTYLQLYIKTFSLYVSYTLCFKDYLCQYVCWFMHMCTCVYRCSPSPEGSVGSCELELKVFVSLLMWVLRSELHTTEEAVSTLNFWAVSVALSNRLQSWFKNTRQVNTWLLKKMLFKNICLCLSTGTCVLQHTWGQRTPLRACLRLLTCLKQLFVVCCLVHHVSDRHPEFSCLCLPSWYRI